jgi:hypothetical protein
MGLGKEEGAGEEAERQDAVQGLPYEWLRGVRGRRLCMFRPALSKPERRAKNLI